jgi:8-oxo-dGTP pyrophosphatase MutT (NUDIX family)
MMNNEINKERLNQNVEHEKKVNSKRNVAIAALRNRQGQVLLVRTARLPGRWQPLGGGMDGDETPTEAVVREIKEETQICLSPDDIEEIVQIPYDFGEGTIYFFLSKETESFDNIIFDPNEIEEHGWFDIPVARNLPLFDATAKFLDILIDRKKQI